MFDRDAQREVARLRAEINGVASLNDPAYFIARGSAYVSVRSYHIDKVRRQDTVQRERLNSWIVIFLRIRCKANKRNSVFDNRVALWGK